MTDPPLALLKKLKLTQAAIKPLVKSRQTDDQPDSYRFVPASDVFDQVAGQLHKRGVLLLPAVKNVMGTSGTAEVRVTLAIRLIDTASGESLVAEWAGEGDGVAAAKTSAIKSYLVDLFQVPVLDPEPQTRHEARAREVKQDPKLTQRQIGAVERACEKARLPKDRFLSVLDAEFGTTKVELVPRGKLSTLLTAIEKDGEAVDALRRANPAHGVPAAAANFGHIDAAKAKADADG